jgi:hypothetical protein
MKENEPNELTNQANSFTLDRGVNNNMPELGSGEFDRPAPIKQSLTSDQERARAALGKLNPLTEDASVEERATYGLIVGELKKRAGLDNVATHEETPGLEEERELTEREKQVQDILESADDFYSALEQIMATSSPQVVKKIIDDLGDVYVDLLAFDLDKNSRNRYEALLEEARRTRSVNEEKEKLVDVLRSVKSERASLGEPDPVTKRARGRIISIDSETTARLRRLGLASAQESRTASPKNYMPDTERNSAGVPVRERGKRRGEDEPIETSYDRAIEEIVMQIKDLDNNPELRYLLKNNQVVGALIFEGYGSNKFKTVNDAWESMVTALDGASPEQMDALKYRMVGFLNQCRGQLVSRIAEEKKMGDSNTPRSVQELAKWIASTQDSDLWGEGGEYQLLNADGTVNQTNYVMWLREEAVKLHNLNPNDPMSPLSAVNIATAFREIPVLTMAMNKEQYLRDIRSGRVLSELADEMLNEAFLFGEFRNQSLAYIQGMGDDQKIGETMLAIHARSILTRPGNLRFICELPEDFVQDKSARDHRLGDAFRTMDDIYYHISNPQQLQDILRSKPITIEDFKDVLRIVNDLPDWAENISDFGDIFYQQKGDNGGPEGVYYKRWGEDIQLFNGDGSVNWENMVGFLNFYNQPTDKATTVRFVRELVRLKGGQVAGLHRMGIAFGGDAKELRRKEFEKWIEDFKSVGKSEEEAQRLAMRKLMLDRTAHRVNIEFVDNIAYSLQRPDGAAAKHDLGRAGADAAAKANVEDYLAKMGDPDRGGAIGIPEQLGLFRDLMPDPITGMRTEGGRTIYQIFTDLRKLDNGDQTVGKTREQLLDELRFNENTEVFYARNQQNRAMKIFHMLNDAKALDIDKIVTWTPVEGVRMDVGEFQRQINEELIKNFRYAFINSNIDFSEEVPIYRSEVGLDGKVVKNADGRVIKSWRQGTLAERTLGTQLYGKLRHDYETGNYGKGDNPTRYNTFEEFLHSRDGSIRIAKNASLGVLAAQIRSHRKFRSLSKRWTTGRTETFIGALETIQDYEDDGNGNYVPIVDSRYYSDEDFEWLRQQGRAEIWRMLSIDASIDISVGGLEGILKIMQAAMKS